MTEHPPESAVPALLAGLAVQADKLTAASIRLAIASDHQRQSYRFSRQLKFIIGGFVILVAGLLTVALINLSTGRAIRSCTTPGGACYDRSQQQTGKAVQDIVTAINTHTDLLVIATLQCSHKPSTDTQFAMCLRSKGIR